MSNPDSKFYFIEGFKNYKKEDYERAIEDFSKVIELDLENSRAYNLRANSKFNIRDYEGAFDDYSKAINLDCNFESALYCRGITQSILRNDVGAIEDYSKLVELFPNYKKANIPDRIITHPNNDPTKEKEIVGIEKIFYLRGNAKRRLGDFEGAIEDHTRVIELDPKNWDGYDGRACDKYNSQDLILLDLMLPSVDGLTLCQRLRRDERTSNIPILMITALGGLKDKVTGFNSGADDYITKPFDLEELYVRIKALLRRTNRAQLNSSNQQEILNYGPLTLVPERFEAIWFESPVRLTHLEFELLHCLLQRHGQTVSPALILKEVWGYEPDDDIETIRVHIRHLRTKLEPDPRKPIYIKTVYGAGYCLELPIGSQVETARQEFIQARNPGLINSAVD